MPKLKTNKSVKKRFKITGTGKIVYHRSFGSHLLSSKSAKRKMKLRKNAVLSDSENARIKRMIPYR
ncbi:MAG: 50S ribosomal protein L35 [Chlamydiota bacterium]|nr:50S ribosomal protein L35 [Chlamydiota bacterium]